VVVPGAAFMERQIKAGVFRKLDRSLLPNWSNSTPRSSRAWRCTTRATSTRSPHVGAPRVSATNVGKVKGDRPERAGDSWNIILDPKQVAKYKDCGVSVLDAPTRCSRLVLAWKGKDPNSQDPPDCRSRRTP